MINQLIKELTFNPINPYDLKEDIFSPKLKTVIPDYDQFLENFYREWLLWIFDGEFEGKIVYPRIIDKIENGEYANYLSNLSVDEKTFMVDSLSKISKDEVEHAEYFLNFIKTIYGDSVTEAISSDIVLDLARTSALQKVENMDLIELLFLYYIGECHLWVCFYQIYKETTDPNKRSIFKKILGEESRHIDSHFKIIKKIKNKITTDSSCYIHWCRNLRYFGLQFVEREFNNVDSIKEQYIRKLIYNSHWHKEFNQILIKKCYQLFEILYPDISIDEFTIIVNQ